MGSKLLSGASRREFLRSMGLAAGALLAAACSQAAPAAPTTAPAPAGGATPAAGAAGKSNGTKLTVWGWQSFTPEGDKALGDQMQQWGSANNTQVEYVVVSDGP